MNPTHDPMPDIKGMTQKQFHDWALGIHPAPTGVVRYDLTEAGHRYLDETAFAALCEKHDADMADSYGERLIEAYVSHHETADAREVLDQADVPGSVPSVLRSAARYLERHGWTQGAYFDPTATIFTPAADVAGAIAMVCYGGPVEAPAQMFDHPGFAEFEAAVLHLDRWLLVEDGTEAYEFNDAKGRTVDDVVHALRQAAATPEHELLADLRVIDEMNDRLAKSGVTVAEVIALLDGGDVE
jgi:hypothetical protein